MTKRIGLLELRKPPIAENGKSKLLLGRLKSYTVLDWNNQWKKRWQFREAVSKQIGKVPCTEIKGAREK